MGLRIASGLLRSTVVETSIVGKNPRLRAFMSACCGSQERTHRFGGVDVGSLVTWWIKPETDPVATHSPPARTLTVACPLKQQRTFRRKKTLLGSGPITVRLVVAGWTG